MAVLDKPTDNELIQSAQQGQVEAFTVLYERYLPMVYNRVRATVPPQDIEDVTQEVFIAVLKSLHTFRGESRFGTWLRTLTVRQIAEYYRRRPKLESELDDNLRAPLLPGSSEEAFLVRQAFRRIPGRYQEIILLRFTEGMHFNEIAILRNQSLEAVKSLFRRAIAALDVQLKSDDQK